MAVEEQLVDVFVIGVDPRHRPPPTFAEGLEKAFDISRERALAIEQNLPCVVKRGVGEAQVRALVPLLEKCGAVVELRAADPRRKPAPGGVRVSVPIPLVGASVERDPLRDRNEAPQTADEGHVAPISFTDDQLELADVGPRRPPKRSRIQKKETPSVAPPGGQGIREPKVLGVVVDRAEERAQRMRVVLPAVFALLIGGALLAFGFIRGTSCFLGTASLFTMVLDALGIAGVAVGGFFVVSVGIFRAPGTFSFMPGAAALVLSYGAAFGVNYLQSDGNVTAHFGSSPAASAFLRNGGVFARTTGPGSRRLLADLEAAGATRVAIAEEIRRGGDRVATELLIELPREPLQRSEIERVVRRYLGPRLRTLEDRRITVPSRGRLWQIPLE